MTDSIGHAAMQDAARREGGGAGINTVEIARKRRKEHASTGFSAAAMRALSARLLTFYFRAPVKAFFRPRIDYMGFARAINPHVKAGEAWSWRMTSPFLIASAVKQYGWGFIPNHLLPPLIANTAVGAILYAAYLQSLGTMHEPSSRSTKRVYPPPPPTTSFLAGFVAGSIQSVFAAPLDALQTRFQSTEMLKGKYRDMSMWHYGWLKTREIGARGIFAGWSLSFLRDSLGAGVFFATFETIKSQAFYSFVSTWYGDWAKLSQKQKEDISIQMTTHGRPEIRPHYMVEPTFLALAGVSASITQAFVQHPIQRIQEIHYGRLAWIDSHDRHQPGQRKVQALKLYATAYRKTIKQFLTVARREKGVWRWLYRDFFRSTATQVPSTAAGLIIFEIFRRKYGNDDEAVRIPKNGYEIVLI